MRVILIFAAVVSTAAFQPRSTPRRMRQAASPSLRSRAPESDSSAPATTARCWSDALPAASAAMATAAIAAPALATVESAAWAGPVASVLSPTLLLLQFLMLSRTIMSWYPEVDINTLPWNLVAWPTEPLLKGTRAVLPPAFGVDISPIFWVAVASLASEILLGQYGVLSMLQRG